MNPLKLNERCIYLFRSIWIRCWLMSPDLWTVEFQVGCGVVQYHTYQVPTEARRPTRWRASEWTLILAFRSFGSALGEIKIPGSEILKTSASNIEGSHPRQFAQRYHIGIRHT